MSNTAGNLKKLTILLTTIGPTWQIPPERYGFTNPADLDLYAQHPERERFEAMRREQGITPVRELWGITTGGQKTTKEISHEDTGIQWQSA